jgi:hypothetical protein
MADSRNLTRADLLEEWIAKSLLDHAEQAADHPHEITAEVISSDTRKTGTQLAIRLAVSSAALTNWIKAGNLRSKTRHHDPDGITWDRLPGTKFYRPVM